MSRRSHRRLALFGLVLLIGQLLQVAHAYEHPALSVHPVCQVCLHGQGLDSGALAPGAMSLLEFGVPAPSASALPTAVHTRPASDHRSRGPPAFLPS